jgi:Flp pilus assembly protein TadG
MAVIMPVFLTLVLGCLDFGRFAYNLIAVTNAARAGAGVAIVSRYPDPDPATNTGLVNWRASICEAVASELGMATDFTPVGSSDPDGSNNSQGLYVQATRSTETEGLWRVQVTVRVPFTWWSVPSHARPQQTVVFRAIR